MIHDLRSLKSWYIKGTAVFLLEKYPSFPLIFLIRVIVDNKSQPNIPFYNPVKGKPQSALGRG